MAKILVVEDETIIAMQLEAWIQDLGHEAVGAAVSGEDAVALAATTRPDMVFMDIKLSGQMDGIEAARVLRSRFDIPVMFTTAYAEDLLVERAKATEPLGYIVKPFHSNEIKAAIAVAVARMELERRLRDQERRYRLATLAGRVGIWDWEPETGRVHLDPIWKQLLGRTCEAEECDFEQWLSWVHPEDRDRVRAELQIEGRGGMADLELERRLLHADGTVSWFLARSQTGIDPITGKRYVIGTDVDISARKRAEKALSKSKERFRSLVETTDDLIWEMDRDLKFTYVSPRIATLLGYSPAEVTGKSPSRLLADGESGKFQEHLAVMAAAERAPHRFETVLCHRDGSQVVVETSGIGFPGAGGRLLGYRGISRDVSERRRLEEALRTSNARLETMVAERTRHLQQLTETLRQQQLELARRSAEAVTANQRLREANAALMMVNKTVQHHREEQEQRMAQPVRSRILPLVRTLETSGAAQATKENAQALAGYLESLVLGFAVGADIASRLSAAEWKVAVLIKEGLGNRDIAQRLRLSVDTVKTHRKNIRAKLGLRNSSMNLGTYLMTQLP